MKHIYTIYDKSERENKEKNEDKLDILRLLEFWLISKRR
jgi:hypothetical protein